MLKQECYKIFSRKSIYIVLFCIVLFIGYANLLLPGDDIMKDEIYTELYDKWGGPITEKKISLAREAMRASDERGMEEHNTYIYTEEDRAAGEVHFLVSVAGWNAADMQERKEYLQEKLTNIHKPNYTNRKAAKELSMYEKVEGSHGFYLIGAWKGMLDFIEPIPGVIFLSTLVILGLTPVFAEEYSKGTGGLIRATKHGKRKIVTAKILASIIYIFVMLMLLHIANMIMQWIKFGGFEGWDAPIQGLHVFHWYYGQSPFAWDMWQLYFMTFAIQFLACVALGLMVLFISVWTRNTMLTFFIGAIVISLPLFYRDIVGGPELIQLILHFLLNFISYVHFMSVNTLFEQFKAYNLFGFPILYPQLMLLFHICLAAIVVVAIYYRYRNQQITN